MNLRGWRMRRHPLKFIFSFLLLSTQASIIVMSRTSNITGIEMLPYNFFYGIMAKFIL